MTVKSKQNEISIVFELCLLHFNVLLEISVVLSKFQYMESGKEMFIVNNFKRFAD